jgi:cell division protein FtsL
MLAPWMVMALIGVVAFLGLGFARTSLDKSAFELDRLNRAITEQAAMNEQLRLEIARLENPARVAPLAEEMGLVIPGDTRQLLVDLGGPAVVSTDEGGTQ